MSRATRHAARRRAGLLASLLLAAGVVGYAVLPARGPAPAPSADVRPLDAPRPALDFQPLEEPRPLPELAFTDADGAAVTLDDFRGMTVLLNVWATWCVPCREEMPTLDRLQAELGGEDFEVIALSIDRGGLADVEGFFTEIGIESLAVYLDQPGASMRALGVVGLPTTLLIDRDGREIGRVVGPAEWDSPEVIALIERHRDRPAAGDATIDRNSKVKS